ncbi:uncharacterized protein MYCFIDRAFT_209035 [Pseudocercospora fijiensis CIRAD86]|uniref:Uncharacterized protein n=1 Tax=Pseudocercospora fijiensis (strain CIRAD86) TaxID=383855 RepID=M2ZHS6_PSEFD|nr:uncharacterized protein MYCFIDRAFT_209035 [Pseudocercospora fijiensis CIRAD86]EME78669.1 hypothetical protein MYCFIDRAFT_209035 [Pseudocercospora fijiensis CIRAD86]
MHMTALTHPFPFSIPSPTRFPGNFNLLFQTHSQPMATSADTDLDERIQILPQELQDIIFDFTLSPNSDRVIAVTSNYRAPSQLQISRKSRDVAAARYYSSNAFTFTTGKNTRQEVFYFIQKWVASLPRLHASMLRELRLPMLSKNELQLISRRAFSSGFVLRLRVDQIRYLVKEKGIDLEEEMESERKWCSLKDANDARVGGITTGWYCGMKTRLECRREITAKEGRGEWFEVNLRSMAWDTRYTAAGAGGSWRSLMANIFEPNQRYRIAFPWSEELIDRKVSMKHDFSVERRRSQEKVSSAWMYTCSPIDQNGHRYPSLKADYYDRPWAAPQAQVTPAADPRTLARSKTNLSLSRGYTYPIDSSNTSSDQAAQQSLACPTAQHSGSDSYVQPYYPQSLQIFVGDDGGNFEYAAVVFPGLVLILADHYTYTYSATTNRRHCCSSATADFSRGSGASALAEQRASGIFQTVKAEGLDRHDLIRYVEGSGPEILDIG